MKRRTYYNAADFIVTVALAATIVSLPVGILWALAKAVMR